MLVLIDREKVNCYSDLKLLQTQKSKKTLTIQTSHTSSHTSNLVLFDAGTGGRMPTIFVVWGCRSSVNF